MNYIDTWGVYQCFTGTNEQLVDAEYRKDFFELKPNGKVFHCIDMMKEKLVITYGDKTFIVDPKAYKVVKEPKYKIDDMVKIIDNGLDAKIIEIDWHYKDENHIYYLEVQGKRESKRYNEDELSQE